LRFQRLLHACFGEITYREEVNQKIGSVPFRWLQSLVRRKILGRTYYSSREAVEFHVVVLSYIFRILLNSCR
jgi:hypothetical protein